jgi:hypothetical protein
MDSCSISINLSDSTSAISVARVNSLDAVHCYSLASIQYARRGQRLTVPSSDSKTPPLLHLMSLQQSILEDLETSPSLTPAEKPKETNLRSNGVKSTSLSQSARPESRLSRVVVDSHVSLAPEVPVRRLSSHPTQITKRTIFTTSIEPTTTAARCFPNKQCSVFLSALLPSCARRPPAGLFNDDSQVPRALASKVPKTMLSTVRERL